jgi:uncharacterized membrane protein
MHRHTTLRFIVMVIAGLAAAGIAVALGAGDYAPTIGWAVAAAIYSAWVWLVVFRFDGETTEKHSLQEEPARGVMDALVVVLSVASLVSVGFVLVHAAAASGIDRFWLAALALGSVALSWVLLHTLFALRYARLYYGGNPGGIEFNEDEKPRYTDFAYVSFTLGMTYQVSDTNITSHTIRSAVLGHSLLSFLFGSFILATTINLIAGLGG